MSDWVRQRYAQMSWWERFWWKRIYGGVWLGLCDKLSYARDWVLDRPENVWGYGPMGEHTEWLGYRGTRTKRPIDDDDHG